MPPAIGADFPGAKCPPGSRVHFRHGGAWTKGTVTALKRHAATVVDASGAHWSVPYGVAQVLERAPSHCDLAEVLALARRLMGRSVAAGELGADWTFGFDLAASRAGVCRYQDKRIDLSASFCLKATRAEITDTLLHEIAHAIVGQPHGHDAIWQAKALELGCSGATRHSVSHAIAAWVGECGCPSPWLRQRLQRSVAQGRVCAKCRRPISWRRNVELATPEADAQG